MAEENGAEALNDDSRPEAGEVVIEQGQEQLPANAFDVEEFAGSMGWAPKDQWRGDPEGWKPADQFVRDTVSVNQTLTKKLKNLERTTQRMVRTTEQLAEQRIEDMRTQLEVRLEQAVDEGDKETVKHVTTRIQQLNQQRPAADPDVAEFAERNAEWFNVDPEATALAMGVAENLAKQGKTASEQVAAAERAVKRRFPELFEEPQRAKQPAAVHQSDTRSAPRQKSGPKGFAELPADAKQQALRMESKGRCTRDEYAKIYWQENA